MHSGFSYEKAFSRNIGWVTESEQQKLRVKRVAIAGLGGVGGSHLLTLTRMGIAEFTIADFDTFDIVNFNRQAGATIASLGLSKTMVLSDMARAINPELSLTVFNEEITKKNLDTFLDRVDLYVDGLDFFAFSAREAVFDYCTRHNIPAITVAPMGMSAALVNFLPGSMSFEEYFQIAGCSEEEKSIRFLVGLAPSLPHRHYLVDRSRVDLKEHRGPSTAAACDLCAGVAATEAIKILLGRGKIHSAPHSYQFDSYSYRLIHSWRPGGNRNPLNRLAIALLKHQLERNKRLCPPENQ